MKILEAIKLLCLGMVITVIGICLRGHDILTGVSLSLLALLVTLKLLFAWRARRNGGSSSRGGGRDPGGRPVPRGPLGRPPVLAAEAEFKTRHTGIDLSPRRREST
jgi:hypothetical protein